MLVANFHYPATVHSQPGFRLKSRQHGHPQLCLRQNPNDKRLSPRNGTKNNFCPDGNHFLPAGGKNYGCLNISYPDSNQDNGNLNNPFPDSNICCGDSNVCSGDGSICFGNSVRTNPRCRQGVRPVLNQCAGSVSNFADRRLAIPPK